MQKFDDPYKAVVFLLVRTGRAFSLDRPEAIIEGFARDSKAVQDR